MTEPQRDAYPALPVDDDAEAERLADLLPRLQNRQQAIDDIREIIYSLNWEFGQRETTSRAATRKGLKAAVRRLESAPPRTADEAASILAEFDAPVRDAIFAVARSPLRGRAAMTEVELLVIGLEPSRSAGLGSTPATRTKLEDWVRRALVEHRPQRAWVKPTARQRPDHEHSISLQKRIDDAYDRLDAGGAKILQDLSPQEWEASQQACNGQVLSSIRRPRDEEVQAAVQALADVWQEQTGDKPTLITETEAKALRITRGESHQRHRAQPGKKRGPFFDFCHAVIDPVRQAHGAKCPSLGNHIQQVLYPSSDEEAETK